MKFPRLFQIIILNVILIQQIGNVSITKNNILNVLLMKRSRYPYIWQDKLPDYTSIILNDQLVQAMNQQQHLTDVQALYNEVISKMYEQIPVQDLVEQFWKIYNKYNFQSFITMTRAQLALYWRYRLDKIQDPYYVLLAGHCFYKIKNDVFFSRLNEATKHLVDTTLKSLPTSLQYLFGKTELCLRNEYQNEFMYQSSKGEVLTSSWFKNLTDYMAIIEHKFEETLEDNLSDLNLSLFSKHYGCHFRRLDNYDHKIVANNTKQEQHNSLWSVELVNNNQLVFRQDDYLLCSRNRRVYGLKKTIYDQDCQWVAEECNASF